MLAIQVCTCTYVPYIRISTYVYICFYILYLLMQTLSPFSTATLTSSLLPVRSRGRGADKDDSDTGGHVSPSNPPSLEIQEFLGDFHSPRLEPHLSLTHHLYVYPVTLKYDSQKAFAKVHVYTRTSVCVKVKKCFQNRFCSTILFEQNSGTVKW